MQNSTRISMWEEKCRIKELILSGEEYEDALKNIHKSMIPSILEEVRKVRIHFLETEVTVCWRKSSI